MCLPVSILMRSCRSNKCMQCRVGRCAGVRLAVALDCLAVGCACLSRSDKDSYQPYLEAPAKARFRLAQQIQPSRYFSAPDSPTSSLLPASLAQRIAL